MSQIYYVKQVVFWCHFKQVEDVYFHSVEFGVDGLSEFVWKSVFEINQVNKSWWCPIFSPDSLELSVSKEDVKIYIWECNKMKFYFINKGVNHRKMFEPNIRGKGYQWPIDKITLNNEYVLKVVSVDDRINIDEIEAIAINIQRLFSLIFMSDVKLAGITIRHKVFRSDETKKFLRLSDDYYIKDIDIFFNTWFIFQNYRKKYLKKRKKALLFQYVEVDSFIGIIENFFRKSEEFRTIYNLYYATIWNKWLHLENTFLNVVQAIEWMYNKSHIYAKNLEKDDISDLKSELNEKWFSNTKLWRMVIFKEEKTLDEKLKDIEEYLWIVFSFNEWKNLRKNIVEIRNTFSHWWDRSDIKIKNLYEIYLLLLSILEIFVIKELWIWDNLYKKIVRYKMNIQLPIK